MEQTNCAFCQKQTKLSVFCTNCKVRYCNAKCKKNGKKEHSCAFVPSERQSSGPQKISLMALAGGRQGMILEPDVEKVLYGETSKGDELRILPLKSGGTAPSCPPQRIIALVLDSIANHYPFFRELIPDDREERYNGYLKMRYTDYEHFARCYLDNNTATITWEDDLMETREGVSNTYRTLVGKGGVPLLVQIESPDPHAKFDPRGNASFCFNRVMQFPLSPEDAELWGYSSKDDFWVTE